VLESLAQPALAARHGASARVALQPPYRVRYVGGERVQVRKLDTVGNALPGRAHQEVGDGPSGREERQNDSIRRADRVGRRSVVRVQENERGFGVFAGVEEACGDAVRELGFVVRAQDRARAFEKYTSLRRPLIGNRDRRSAG
jgi:hypothetical protein